MSDRFKYDKRWCDKSHTHIETITDTRTGTVYSVDSIPELVERLERLSENLIFWKETFRFWDNPEDAVYDSYEPGTTQ